MNDGFKQPVGVVLAGGRGRRLGGDKAMVALAGRPLISYPIGALRSALAEVRVVAKPGTVLPGFDGVELWTEPVEPSHPLVGVVEALRRAAPRPVLVCAADMPFLTTEAVSTLASVDPGAAPAVVAVGDRGLEPLLARYEQSALAVLEPAARQARAPLREVVATLEPRRVEVDPDALFNVNSPEDLARAERRLSQMRRRAGP